MNGRILSIAGSDSGGGAGIQGDIKTITSLGGYASTAITALTAQNTLGVSAIHKVPADFIKQQIEVVLSDIGADAIKTGMLLDSEIISIVADSLDNYRDIPLIIDPVMIAKGGTNLLKNEAIDSMKTRLFPLALIITPNIPEAETLTDMKIVNIDDMKISAKKLLKESGAEAILIKGRHLESDAITDVLITMNGVLKIFNNNKINTNNTHGTGCTLASAIATFIAQKNDIETSVEKAIEYVQKAIKSAPNIGKGHGPLNHLL